MNIEQVLNQLGFSANETRVYLATLDLVRASAQDVAQKAALPRTTVYPILRKLIYRGLVAKTLEKNKTRFMVENPEKLLELVEGLEQELRTKMDDLRNRYRGNSSKPRIALYEGNEAIQKVLDDTLHSKPSEILEWNTDQFFNYDRYKIDRSYISKRVKLNIPARRLASAGSDWETKHKTKDVDELSKTRILSTDRYSPNIEVNIYSNKIAFINYTESMSLIIESEPIASAMKQIYELTWKQAETENL